MAKKNSLAIVRHICDQYEDDPQKQLKELKKAIEEGQKSNDILLMGAAYYDIAILYNSLDDLDNSLSNCLKAVVFLEKTKEYELLAKAYVSLGYVYGEQENYQMSFVSSLKAYDICRKHRIYTITRIVAINNLATSYNERKETKKAISLMEESIDLITEEMPDNYTRLAMHTINLANFYKDDQKVDTAIKLLEDMESWVDKIPFTPLACDYYLRRAIIAFETNNKEEGNHLVDKSFDYLSNSYPSALYDDYRKVSRFLVMNKDWSRAERIVKLMQEYCDKHTDSIGELIANQTFADYYKGKGDYKTAAEYYAKVDELHGQRTEELKIMQLNVYKKMEDTELEVQKLSAKMKENERLMLLEPMTKLLNRSGLLKVALDFFASAEKKKQKVGAIFVDIDFFKECNDTYGHAKGDEIIKIVANACKQEEKDNLKFARYGGDEFFAVAHGLKDKELIELAKRICRHIQTLNIPNEKNPNGHIITLSVGLINININESIGNIIDIINYADKAMYHAKNTGKNSIYLLEYSKEDKSKTANYTKIEF